MNDDFSPHKAPEQPAESATPAPLTSGQQRRRLLRTVAATGAVVGVGLPLAAHATVRPHCKKNNDANPSNNYHPTASAVGSMIGSSTGGVLPICGHSTSHYCGNAGNWIAGWTNGRPAPKTLSWDRCGNTSFGGTKRKFAEVFEVTSPTGPQDRNCAEILNTYGTSDEAIWLTAILNANKRSPLFPYTASQVVDLYKGVNPIAGGTVSGITLRDKAVILFRDYLSQGVV